MPNKNRTLFRSAVRALALEPRLLFDGAGAVAVADNVDSGHDNSAQHHEAPAADARPQEVLEGGAAKGVLLIIDARVADQQSLLAGLPANVTVRVIGNDESGLGVIGQELAKGGTFDAVHIVSHGTPGNLTLGSDSITKDSLSSHSAELQSWAANLSADADILLYGCEIAQGEQGQVFIDELAHLTGADIAASTNATGNADKSGDWVLESSTGRIEASALVLAGYGELLAAPTVTDIAPADEPFAVGENTAKVVGKDITITGTGTDSLTVTASVTKGTLSATTFSGDATAVQTWLDSLSYTYTGTSQTGDSETLTLNITNTTSLSTTNFIRNISIAPENDAPTLTPPASGAGRLTVGEGGNATFVAATGNGTVGNPVGQINLGLVDVDNTANQIIIKLTSQPAQGVLKLNGNELTIGSTFAVSDITNLQYQHNGSQVLSNTTDAFQITVDDGAGGLLTLQTVTVDITPVNQAPAVSGNITLIEGETGVALVGGIVPVLGTARGDLAIGDPDDNIHTVQVKGLPAHGTLKYNGTVVTNGQIITNADLSKFTYDHDGSETTSDSFKLLVTDAGGGTVTAASSAETTINLTVIPNNDDPVWDSSTLPNASNEFGPVKFGPDSGTGNLTAVLPITNAMLQVIDAESGPERLTYTLTAIPAGGYLTSSAYPGQSLPVGFSFTQKDINEGKISFVSTNGNSNTTDFKFTIMDGDRRLIPNQRDGGIYGSEAANAPITVHTFKIEYEGVATGPGPGAAVPVAQINAPGGSMSLDAGQIAEGQTFKLSATQLSATSTNPAITDAQLTYRLLSLPDNGKILLNGTALGVLGSFTQADINAGKVTFQHDGGENFTSAFTFDVSNGTNTTTSLYGISTFNIDVKPQNDTPTAGNGEPIKLLEGGNIVINAGGKTHITLGDSDNDTSDKTSGYAQDNVLSFKVTVLPTHGKLQLNGTDVIVNQIITKADLDGGQLKYVHDASENYTDAFTIVPVDNQGVASTSNNTDANANPPSGNPTNQASTGTAAVINISVNPLNDAPTFVSIAEPGYNGVPALKEGTEFIIGGASAYAGSPGYGTGSGVATPEGATVPHLAYQDSDNTSEQRQYRITTATQYGVLTAGGRVLGVGSVFTQAELDSGAVKYKHGGGEQFDDKFEYVVSDGDFSSNQSTLNNGTAAVQGNAITPSEYRIKLERSNDKPTISTGFDVVNGLFVVDSSVTAQNLPTFTLGDKDLVDGVQAGETDFVQVSVEFLQNDGTTPYTNGVLLFSGTLPAGVTVTNAAGDNTLVFQGNLVEVRAALALVQARTNGTDADAADLKIKVSIDDRLRDGTGVFSAGANGGAINDDGSPPNNTFNISSVTINVAASDKNDPPAVVVAAGPIVVNEDVRTLINTAITSYTDPDAFKGTGNTVTLTVTKGTLYFSATGSTVPADVTVTAGAISSNTVTLQGTKAALDLALGQLRYVSNTDYNGDDSLTVTVGDGNNTGIDGPDNSGLGSNTGIVAIAIRPVNDTPTVTLPGANGYFPITGGSYVFSAANSNAIVIADGKDFTGAAGAQDGLDNNFKVTLNAKLGADSNYGAIAITTPGSVVVTGAGTGTVTLTGTRADINAALANGVTFASGAGNLDGTVTFTVTVDDNNNGGTALIDPETGTAGITGPQTASKMLYLQPTSINDAPVFAGLDNTPTFVQGGSAVVLDGNALLSDPELDLFGANGNWNGSVLTLQRDGGANAFDVFGTTGSGSTGVNINGTDLRIGSTVVGTVTNTGGTLQITFNSAATASLVDAVLQGLTYKNTDTNPDGSVKINYTIDDQNPNNTDNTGLPVGTGQDQGTGGKLVGLGSITIGINRQIIATPDVNAITEGVVAGGALRTVSGDVTPGATNSNDNGGTQDRDPDAGQTIVVQGVKAGAQGSVAAIGTAGVGLAITGQYGSVVINADGTYTYSLDDTNPDVNALKPGDTLTDVFSYAINDGQGVNETTDFTTLTITVNGANDPPVATDNTNSVTEDSAIPATGNVRTDGTADSDPDNVIAELSISGIRPGSEVSGGVMTPVNTATDSSNGTQVTGLYGTLTLGADGSYSYVLDNSNTAVNALQDGQTLIEVFTYTLRDPGNATDTAALTITINGQTDGVPQIGANDGNASATGQASVFEKGLTSASDNSETTTGTLTVKAPDGIKTVTIGGTTITVAELQAIQAGSNPPVSIDTGEGTLRITGITVVTGAPGAPTEANVTYSYTLKVQQDQPGATESSDIIALEVTDTKATPVTATGTLTVQIIDDTPTAVAESNIAVEGITLTVSAANGVLKNDSSGADGWVAGGAVVGVIAGNAGTPTTDVGSSITGTYGTLILQADGSYSYEVTDTSGVASRQDVFTYTVRDSDGDQTTTTLTININNPPLANDDTRSTPEDTPITGNIVTGSGGDVADSDPEGDTLTVTQIVIGGTPYTVPGDGSTATVNIPGNGTLVIDKNGSYTFTPTADWHGSVPPITYTISDGDGGTDTAELNITVTPVVDIADDKTSTTSGIPVTINVLPNDSFENSDRVVTSVTQATNGTVSFKPDGSITYTPALSFFGTDTFTYTVTSGGVTETATVTIDVIAENPPVQPIAPMGNGDPIRSPLDGPRLQSTNALLGSPVTLDAGPYYANERFDDVRRMQLPFHPIVYVNREVQAAQAERAHDDSRSFSDTRAFRLGEQRLTSQSLELGMDPNLFVTHAIRDSQLQSRALNNMVDGRYGRADLSSEGDIQQTSLFREPVKSLAELLKERKKQQSIQLDTEEAGSANAATPDADETPRNAEQTQAMPTERTQNIGRSGSPSFADQLRTGAGRLPLAQSNR